ncbi:MAG TPA: hypothetical protein DEV93_18045 [Chloroflexi bacterium]|nr:hypothetical protein [Chloroflexota bacterium]
MAALHATDGLDSFLYCLLQATSDGWEKFNAEGTVFGSVSKRDVHGFTVLHPPDEVMDSFNRLAQPMDAVIEVYDREAGTLGEIRDVLLPKLLSGEIRVEETEKIAGAAL